MCLPEADNDITLNAGGSGKRRILQFRETIRNSRLSLADTASQREPCQKRPYPHSCHLWSPLCCGLGFALYPRIPARSILLVPSALRCLSSTTCVIENPVSASNSDTTDPSLKVPVACRAVTRRTSRDLPFVVIDRRHQLGLSPGVSRIRCRCQFAAPKPTSVRGLRIGAPDTERIHGVALPRILEALPSAPFIEPEGPEVGA